MKLDHKLLSLAYKNKKFAMELVNSTKEEYYDNDFKWLYSALEYYFNDPNVSEIPSKNMVTEFLADDVEIGLKLKQFDEVVNSTVEENEFSWLLEKLRFKYNDSVHTDMAHKVVSVLKSKPAGKERVAELNAVLKECIVNIDSIHKRTTYKEGTLRDSAKAREERYTYIKENPEAAQGILTGFSSFDQKTNGLHPGEFMIIAGDTGTGKSILMHNIGVNAYLGKNDPFDPERNWDSTGHNILYFSLEMPKESMERRIDSCMGGVYSTHIRDGLLSDEDERKYFHVLNFQAEYNKNFHIVDMPKGATTREIELKYLEICETGWKPDLVIIDYMGIMSANETTGSDWMDQGVITAELHEFARVYEVAVITGSQVNRTKDGAERYDTDRLARSNMAPTNANIVLQIGKRSDEYVRTDMPVYIIKMRDGEKDQFTLTKDFAKMKVMDIVDDTYDDEDGPEDMI